MKKFNYIYLITNLINGQQYVGQHTCDNLENNYLGSGVIIQKAIKKYGKEKFDKKILEICEPTLLNKREIFWIEKINTYNDGYNLTKGGDGNLGWKPSEETKEKIGVANKGNQTWLGKKHNIESKKKISDKSKGRKAWNKGIPMEEKTKEKIKEKNKGQIPWNKNIPMKEETKQKLRKPKSEEHKINLRKPKSVEGKENIKISHNTLEYKEKISILLKGRIFSTETIEKMKNSAKNRKISEETRKKMADSQKKRWNK